MSQDDHIPFWQARDPTGENRLRHLLIHRGKSTQDTTAKWEEEHTDMLRWFSRRSGTFLAAALRSIGKEETSAAQMLSSDSQSDTARALMTQGLRRVKEYLLSNDTTTPPNPPANPSSQSTVTLWDALALLDAWAGFATGYSHKLREAAQAVLQLEIGGAPGENLAAQVLPPSLSDRLTSWAKTQSTESLTARFGSTEMSSALMTPIIIGEIIHRARTPKEIDHVVFRLAPAATARPVISKAVAHNIASHCDTGQQRDIAVTVVCLLISDPHDRFGVLLLNALIAHGWTPSATDIRMLLLSWQRYRPHGFGEEWDNLPASSAGTPLHTNEEHQEPGCSASALLTAEMIAKHPALWQDVLESCNHVTHPNDNTIATLSRLGRHLTKERVAQWIEATHLTASCTASLPTATPAGQPQSKITESRKKFLRDATATADEADVYNALMPLIREALLSANKDLRLTAVACIARLTPTGASLESENRRATRPRAFGR